MRMTRHVGPAFAGPSGRLVRPCDGVAVAEVTESIVLRIPMWIAYILRSVAKGTLYKGSCHDLVERLKDHNAGRVRSTKNGRSWVVMYSEEFESKRDALIRERFFKSRSGYRWLKNQGFI